MKEMPSAGKCEAYPVLYKAVGYGVEYVRDRMGLPAYNTDDYSNYRVNAEVARDLFPGRTAGNIHAEFLGLVYDFVLNEASLRNIPLDKIPNPPSSRGGNGVGGIGNLLDYALPVRYSSKRDRLYRDGKKVRAFMVDAGFITEDQDVQFTNEVHNRRKVAEREEFKSKKRKTVAPAPVAPAIRPVGPGLYHICGY